jgi:hypothetical protein
MSQMPAVDAREDAITVQRSHAHEALRRWTAASTIQAHVGTPASISAVPSPSVRPASFKGLGSMRSAAPVRVDVAAMPVDLRMSLRRVAGLRVDQAMAA